MSHVTHLLGRRQRAGGRSFNQIISHRRQFNRLDDRRIIILWLAFPQLGLANAAGRRTEICCHATPTIHSFGAFYASAWGRVLGERPLTPAAIVLNLFSWRLKPLARLFPSGGASPCAARTVGKTARIQSRAVNARTAMSWTWRRWCVRAVALFPCHAWKAVCVARGAAAEISSCCMSHRPAPSLFAVRDESSGSE